MDLTTITMPYGLLRETDPQAAQAIIDAHSDGALIEVFDGQGWGEAYICGRQFHPEYAYRVRPTPKPPAIELPWEVIDPKWKWAAMDADGRIGVYDDKPISVGVMWSCGLGTEWRCLDGLFAGGIRINVTDWKQSLTRRPE